MEWHINATLDSKRYGKVVEHYLILRNLRRFKVLQW